jgi:hypothetical protein
MRTNWPCCRTWLGFLTRVKLIRTIATFAVQYWYYAQLDLLGKEGAAAPALSVLAATRRVMAQQKQWLAARRAG